ncbi:aldo/keto reductase [Sandaracinus amylolyticus]|uniref:aldo/keto reductase n=1 Tax=Sandaracinus amylolyticus TaxID=927083 RepID=UPI001F2D9289|nr:aldo/keto reductase [Sandaracinus amylolyticus]UJR79518.1 Dimethylsulfoxide reductase chain B [Sandaracinus amylolyticus]
MEYRRLGSSGVKVSELCLGAMTFGEPDEKSFMHGVGASEETSFAIMDAALDAGVNFIDTADVYGQDGLSERIVGRWTKERGTRDRIVLATKFRFRMGEGPNGTGASRLRIVRTVEDSLRRLQTDRIDLYQIHMQDVEVPEEETLRALDDLVRAGKVLYLGCSNYAAYRLVESLWTSDVRRLERFVSLQAQYSLLVRDLEREHVPLCEKFGLGILPWSPLAGGFLSGKYERGRGAGEGSRFASSRWTSSFARFDDERGWRTVDAVKQIARELGTTPTAVSLAWLLAKPTVTSVIFGARTIGQLKGNLAATGLRLPADAMKKLDDASAFELGYPYDFMQRIQGRW